MVVSGSTFICLGDFRSQFGAAYNRWRQTEVDANVEDSLFFRRLCGFNRVNFVKYRRGKDNKFFELYTSLVADDVAQVKARILELFPRTDEPVWTLTVSHRERKLINKAHNEIIYKRRNEGIWVPPTEQTDRQGFWLIPGCHVIGCQTDNGIVNGQLYVVKEGRTLQLLDREEVVELADARCIRPCHCLCYYSSQGRTLRGRVRLMISHPKISTTAIIVGLSRATSPELIDAM